MASRLRRVAGPIANETRSTFRTDDGASTTSTAPTSHPHESRSSLKREDWYDEVDDSPSGDFTYDPRASTETYASTVPSISDLDEEDDPKYHVPDFQRDDYGLEPLASTPSEFARFFPSHKRMLIHHDDMSEDGNMNLRLDTEDVDYDGRKRSFTLFHLRMYDLRNREFSLRRYARDSGREVCHSSRKGAPGPDLRPSFQKSMSHALASLRNLSTSKTTLPRPLQRHDSGYHSEDEDALGRAKGPRLLPSNTVRLEFSNYAHVNVKRRGTHKNKRYECEYWGRRYTWTRRVDRHEISYHLVDDYGAVLAHIVPIPLTPREAQREAAKGTWIPPCSFWITNLEHSKHRSEVADLIVATGLIALVDDSIKRRFHSRHFKQVILPVQSPSERSEYVEPDRLVDEMFNRQSPNKRQETPLRQKPLWQGFARS